MDNIEPQLLRSASSGVDKREKLIKSSSVDKLIVRPTRITPLVYFDPNRGLLELRGRSSPENSIQFYNKLLHGLDNYPESGRRRLVANFKFEYFNTSSSKCLFDVFRKLLKVQEQGVNLTVNWCYEEFDDDMQEAGEDYADLLGMDFNFIEAEFT